MSVEHDDSGLVLTGNFLNKLLNNSTLTLFVFSFKLLLPGHSLPIRAMIFRLENFFSNFDFSPQFLAAELIRVRVELLSNFLIILPIGDRVVVENNVADQRPNRVRVELKAILRNCSINLL